MKEGDEVRYFAMLHNAVAISGDEDLEGGDYQEAIKYYHSLLNRDFPDCPITFDLEKAQEELLRLRMTNLVNLTALIEKLHAENKLFTDEGIDKIIDQIHQDCKKAGIAYFPSGYRNLSVGKGHFAGLKIKKLEDKDTFASSCLNHGEGMQYHRKISIKGEKIKYSDESEKREIDLTSEEGREFLYRILELRFDKNQTKEASRFTSTYSADDLYGLFQLYGKEIPVPILEERKARSVTPQRTGTCTVTNTHAMARDSLIESGVNFYQRKRYHFVIKLRSLIAGFEAYCKGEKGYTLPVMEWALNEFSVRMNKYYKNILTDEEMIYCAELYTKINERLSKDKQENIKQKCEPIPYPSVEGEAPVYHSHIFDESKIKSQSLIEIVRDEKNPIKPLNKDEIKPENIKALLLFDEKVRPFPFKEMYDLFNLLPRCRELDIDPFWDQVPQKDIKDIITRLHKIISKLQVEAYDFPLMRARTFALALTAYDIAAQLAPRLEAFQLDNRYTFGLDDVYSEQYFFTDPIAYYTVKHVAKNFEQRAQNKKRIFSNTVNYANGSCRPYRRERTNSDRNHSSSYA